MPNSVEMDLLGYECPEVAIRVKKKLLTMDQGSLLVVITDDPFAPADLYLVCRDLGHEIVEEEAIDDAVRIQIRLGDGENAKTGWPLIE